MNRMQDSVVWDWLEDWERNEVLKIEAELDRHDDERLVLVAKRRAYYQRAAAKRSGTSMWGKAPAS